MREALASPVFRWLGDINREKLRLVFSLGFSFERLVICDEKSQYISV